MAPLDNGAGWDLEEIDGRLRDHVAELVEHLRRESPNKNLSNRRTFRFGSKGSLSVEVDGPDKGRITDWEAGTGKGMSPLQFIQAEIGSDRAGAIRWALEWEGIEGERPKPKAARPNQKQKRTEQEREEAKRRAKVAQIVAEATDPQGTPAELYLRNRGITGPLPPTVRWRANAWRHGGALVLLATDAAGTVRAVQEVYLTAEGAKAPLKVQKRTSGFLAGVAVRLPGSAPLTLEEGPETGLSVWQATGCETWVALGSIGKLVEQVPAGSEVVVGRDADPEGSKADEAVPGIIEALLVRGCRVRLACPPRYPDLKKTDFNNVLQREGGAAIRALFASAKVFGGATPHYPAEPLPVGHAKALLARTVTDWVAHAAAHTEGDVARQVGVKGAAGVGKSSALRRALEARPEILNRHIDILVPQHRLADDMADDLAGGPLRVEVIRGRGYKRPDGSTMCAKADEAEKVAMAGFPVWENMCRRVNRETGDEEVCEHFATCPYVDQFANPEPAVRVLTHEALFLPRNSGMPKPQAVVIDESFHAKALRETNFALDRLGAGLWRSHGREVDPDDQDRRDRIARKVRHALEAGEHPRDHGVTAEQCRFVAALEVGSLEGIGISPGMPHAEQRKRLDGYRRSEALKVWRFWKILEAEIERTGPLRQIELRRNVIRRRSDEPADRLYLFWRRDLELPDVPVLLLDADLDSTIAVKFLPRLEVTEIPVDRRAEVIQVMDTPCSRSKLLAWETAADDQLRRADNRVAEVQALLDVEAANGSRVLLVGYKALAESLKVPEGCAVEWFGNIRGVDRYKSFDCVIVAGREQPPIEALEAEARALFADDPEPLNLTGKLEDQDRTYRMRDGSPATAKVSVHADARVQALLEQVRERQSGQVVDRLRLIHRSTPARVLVLSNVVLDLTVDRLTTWKEIMPTRLEQAAARGMAVPLSATELSRCFRGLWDTREIAKKDLERTFNGDKPYKEYLYRECPHLTAQYRRPGQRGKASPALIRGDTPDPRAALEAVVGPVVWFEVEEPDQAATEVQPESLPASAAQIQSGPKPPEAGRVVLIRPQLPPATLQERHLAIVLGRSRLADLSTRLERFRPPPIPIPMSTPRRAAHA